MLPSYEIWSELTQASISSGSNEWKALDAAYKDYSKNPDMQSNRERLETALNTFDQEKIKKYGSAKSDRDAKGALTALRRYLQKKPVELSAVDLRSIDELGWGQRNLIFRALVGARIRYKKGSPLDMAKKLKDDGGDFADKLKEIMPSSSSGGQAPPVGQHVMSAAEQQANSIWQGILQSITGIAGDLQADAMNALIQAVGQSTYNTIATTIPVLGTVQNGLNILTNLKGIADNELAKHRVDKNRIYTRPGDVQVAINNIQEILSARRVELGIDLAGSVISFSADVASMGIAGPILGVAQTAAKLVNTIYNFVSDHVAMTRANEKIDEALRSRRLLIDVMNSFPFLGAYALTIAETSTILEFCVLEIGDPFHMILIEYYRSKCDDIISQARSIVTQSRFEIVGISRPDAAILEAHNRLKDNLNEKLQRAVEARDAAAQNFADHKKKMGSVFEEMKARQAAKDRAAHQQAFSPVLEQLKQQATMLEMMVMVNDENEREAARLIDIRAMKEAQQQDLIRLQALQQRVKKVLDTYHEQTSGFSGMFTRQSNESTAATQALKPLAESKNPEEMKKLEALVKYLLKKQGAATSPVNTVTQPLKQPSRLFDLLNPAYS
jgi:hypothetical protein